ncbi:hypothetical protein [Aminipila sp.]|uniref:hypothetical protein n=1 Tax=Aminipila sp. TaxID=2060095 RepID=UPI00289C52DE|nr:hypothetical protein [Aminipila sp.]
MRRVRRCQNICIPINQVNLIFDSRTTWRDLTVWLRSYVHTKQGGLGDLDAIKEKLNAVLVKSTNIFSLIFGEQSADEYVDLWNNFINYYDKLIEAQISGDMETVNKNKEKLQENSVQTAWFLAHINPYWTESEWIELLSLYNQMSIDQSTALLNKDDKKDIYGFDKLLTLSSRIGDYYSQGILDYLIYTSRVMT